MEIPIDDLLDCARYGELEDIDGYLKEVQQSRGLPVPSSDARVDFLSTKGQMGNTMLHMAAANGHLGMFWNDIMIYRIFGEISTKCDASAHH